MNKIAIVHFQSVEKYPPVMNVINSIAAIDNAVCTVYTTHHQHHNWFAVNHIKIVRVAKQYQHSVLRYWGYVQFNIVCFLGLLLKQPRTIVVYETFSVLPVYLYKKIFKHTIVFIHHHEYVSIDEVNKCSSYYKFLHKIEKKLSNICNYISQTNNERLQLYLKDYPLINAHKTFTAPNFPPSSWYEFAKLNKQENISGVTKLVHVGAISLNTMHTKKMVEWVVAQNGKYQIDFYTDNITTDAKQLFDSLNSEHVKLLSGKNYFELPQVLIHYDIGLTLYNGHIPNYIYNVPNKVLEYLACGLNIWYSSELISTQKFIEENKINGSTKINFETKIDISAANPSISFNSNYIALINTPNEMINKIKTSFKQ